MILVELTQAVNTNPLLVIKAEELQLFSMKTAIYGDGLLLSHD